MRINVTRKHIRNGEPRRATSCAVALALQDALPTKGFIVASQKDIRIGDSLWEHKSYPAPNDVALFIHKFDKSTWIKRLLMQPFSFELDIK